MNHVLTVGDLLWPAVAIAGVLGVLGALAWLLSIFGDAFKH